MTRLWFARRIRNAIRCLVHGDNAMVVLRNDSGVKANVSYALLTEHGEIRAIERTRDGIVKRKSDDAYANWRTKIVDVYVAPFREDWL